ncbi:MAG: nucleotidyltransferase family protein [Jatrophihabitantaceae bacterium]
MSHVMGVVLAAGSGTRMGAPKAALVLDGSRLIDRAVSVLSAAGCSSVLAVTRADVPVIGARRVINPEPGRGMRSSLALAVEAAPDADALAVLLVDLPGVSAVAVRAVVAAWRPGRIALGSYAGRRGHPTVMEPALWREALSLAGPDEGARALLASRPELVDEVAVPGSADDLDSPEDLARWRARGTS